MITDLFDCMSCENCGYSYKLNGVPLLFERIDLVHGEKETAYICRCKICGATFNKIFSGETENGKGKDSILSQF